MNHRLSQAGGQKANPILRTAIGEIVIGNSVQPTIGGKLQIVLLRLTDKSAISIGFRREIQSLFKAADCQTE